MTMFSALVFYLPDEDSAAETSSQDQDEEEKSAASKQAGGLAWGQGHTAGAGFTLPAAEPMFSDSDEDKSDDDPSTVRVLAKSV